MFQSITWESTYWLPGHRSHLERQGQYIIHVQFRTTSVFVWINTWKVTSMWLWDLLQRTENQSPWKGAAGKVFEFTVPASVWCNLDFRPIPAWTDFWPIRASYPNGLRECKSQVGECNTSQRWGNVGREEGSELNPQILPTAALSNLPFIQLFNMWINQNHH